MITHGKILEEYMGEELFHPDFNQKISYDNTGLREEMTKEAIASSIQFLKIQRMDIESKFCIETKEDQEDFDATFKESLDPANWNLEQVIKFQTTDRGILWERHYNSIPFDGQLRIYVVTDEEDKGVWKLQISVE